MSENLPVIKYDGQKFTGMQKTCCTDVVDSSVPLPEALTKLYAVADVQNAFDCLTVLQHVLMLEAGYLPVNVAEEKCCDEIPLYWQNRVYKILYYHKQCPDVKCQMSCIPLGTLFTSYGTILDMKPHDKISVTLPVKPYIYSNEGYRDPVIVYRKMAHFAEQFKRDFSYPLLQEIYCVSQLEPLIGLLNIPIDMTFHILSFLPAKSLATMCAVNKEFHDIANSSFLWKLLYLQDFPNELPSNANENYNWKELYAAEFKKKKQKEKAKCIESHIQIIPLTIPEHGFPTLHNQPPIRRYIPLQPALPPEVQQAFPHLARRYQNFNPLIQRYMPPNQPFR